ncbi:MAG: M28 family peptidase [Candidatus Hydrothermales bacterium]
MNFLISIGPRVPGTESHKKLREFLFREYKEMGYLCEIDSFFEDNFKFYNLIFKKGKNNFILLGTHYDTKPGIEGANDSGSGVILLLYLAKKLRDLNKNLLFVFFDGEDFGETPPLYGSKHFAKKNYDIKWGIIFDMIGDKNLEIFIEGYSLRFAPDLTYSIFSYAEKKKMNFFIKKLKYYILDDHLPLLESNKKVILLIDFDYPFWHTVEDTWDKISLENIEKLGNFIINYLKE